MKTCCICQGTAASPCHPPHDSSPVTGTSWLFCLPSATHVSSLGLHSIVTSSQNHLQIDKIHLVCWVQNIDIKCAGPPNVNFPPFHRFRGWYLTVTLSLWREDEDEKCRSRLWQAGQDGRKAKINTKSIFTLLCCWIHWASPVFDASWVSPRLKILDSCKLGILPNPLVAWVAQSGPY